MPEHDKVYRSPSLFLLFKNILLLHRLGFVYKKANAELQRAYIEMLEKVLENRGKNDPHCYLDGVHPQHNTQLAYGWIKKGEEKIIKANSGRQRININGALNVDNLDVVIREDDTINTQSTLKLFETIEKKHPEAETILFRDIKNKIIIFAGLFSKFKFNRAVMEIYAKDDFI